MKSKAQAWISQLKERPTLTCNGRTVAYVTPSGALSLNQTDFDDDKALELARWIVDTFGTDSNNANQ